MNFFKKIFYWFSFYANEDERRVGKVFARISENSNSEQVKIMLNELIQQNVAALNLWTEYRYKGYKYLTKSTRQQLYENLELIKDDFIKHTKAFSPSDEQIIESFSGLGFSQKLAKIPAEKLVFLVQIMNYLHPARGLYRYRESSSFGLLLQDPSKDNLIGDCNQIVTLYLLLWSTRFQVSDFEVLTYPGHVALRFFGLDVETTSGEFADYGGRKDLIVDHISQIVSVNLLDTSDEYFKKHKVPPQETLQAIRLAYTISSARQIVEKNLKSAYNNAVVDLMAREDFRLALRYAKESRDSRLIEIVGHNGAVFYMQKNQYASARKFASYAKDARLLERKVTYAEGVYYYRSAKYLEAIRCFSAAGEDKMVRACYTNLFMKEQEFLRNARTTNDLKAYSSTIHRMYDYAKKSQDQKLIEHASELMKHV